MFFSPSTISESCFLIIQCSNSSVSLTLTTKHSASLVNVTRVLESYSPRQEVNRHHAPDGQQQEGDVEALLVKDVGERGEVGGQACHDVLGWTVLG